MLWIVLTLCASVQPDDETAEKIKKLLGDLKDLNAPTAWVAAHDLGLIGADAKDAIPVLREALKAKDVTLRAHAAGALLLIDQKEAERAFPVLRAALKESKGNVFFIYLVNSFGARFRPETKDAVRGLLQLAGEESDFGWIMTDLSLGRADADSKEVVAGLKELLEDKNLKVRVQAARFLTRLDDQRKKETVPVIREGLKLESIEMRLVVARELVRLEPDEKKAAAEALLLALKDKHLQSRCRAAAFLLEIGGEQSEQALQVLRAGLESESDYDAKDVLGVIGACLRAKSDRFKQLQPLLAAALKSKFAIVRAEAMTQVGAIGPLGLAFDKELREAARDKDAEIALPAIEALMRLRPDRAPDWLGQLTNLAEKRDETAQGIKEMLRQVEKLKQLNPTGREEIWAVSLADQLERRNKRDRVGWHREEILRLHTLAELRELGVKAPSKTVPALTRVVQDREGARELVRSQAAVVLGRIGKEARPAIPALNRVARDDQESLDVRAAAREALRLIDKAQ